ncbi:flagellin N-terminal helical domain-containing protein [Caproiciproducens sp. CPB-2]|uniref:flagellin N-terminal helical domain-containing protein n=1 Tax=Caproiciproducens sp. CPB-2 TaxID=3030017 RepID=UPI0023DC8AAE|nr:flagellin [Caproiciproducens sp. CPB-2]MDF1494226.1 flagellin [Caproiciproducens sp. CPB-2]
MRIQHNIAALNANRQLGVNNNAVSKNLEKLSSGYKINRAGDDAAGLAISEKMRGQIRGLDQATNNANDGISLVQTAEGALNETASILQRMKELATQSSNGTYQNEVDRENIQKEVESLKSEIDRIATSTNFNKINLLDGSLSGAGASATDEIVSGKDVTVSGLEAGTKVVFAAGTEGASWNLDTKTLTVNLTAATAYTSADITDLMNSAIGSGAPKNAKATLSADIATTDTVTGVTLTLAKATQAKVDTTDIQTDGFTLDVTKLGATGITNIKIASGTGESGVAVSSGTMTITLDGAKSFSADDINDLVKSATGTDVFKFGFNGKVATADIVTAYNGSTGVSITDGNGTLGGKGLTLQIGASSSSDQQVSLNVGDMSTTGLLLSDISVKSQDDALAAIDVIDNAINTVSGTRADLGALQNRLEHTVTNLGVTSENLTSAESRIRDVDMAKEMMEMTKNNVLAQAAQSMLAQANTQPQNVLKLLQ